jgi:hypothetical protein
LVATKILLVAMKGVVGGWMLGARKGDTLVFIGCHPINN